MPRHLALALLALLLIVSPAAAQKKALFDNTKGETAGNADWIIDDNEPVPSPAQSGIVPTTAENYWTGGISAFGVALVKRGYTVHTLTTAYGITYQNPSNQYDLSNYDLYVIAEPNIRFSAAESTAIFNYVRDGGGLILIVDHWNSDRNSDGYDSPAIANLLDAQKLWGVHSAVSPEPNNWFNMTSTNVNTSPGDSIITGPWGNATGIAFHGGTTFVLYPAINPTVTGDVWTTGTAQGSTSNAMVAHSVYGNGRVVFVGDSSPADDGSATSGNTNIFDGWNELAGAKADSAIFLNATQWATRRGTVIPGDTTPPVVTVTSPAGGETWKAGSTHAITWTATDNVAVTTVDIAYSSDGGVNYTNVIASGVANSGTWNWTVPNSPGTAFRMRVIARDAAFNSGTGTSASNFTIDRWSIVASAGPGGTITPSGTLLQAQGSSRTFTIAASANYHIANVLVNGASVGAVPSYTFSAIAANHTIAASFEGDARTLTVSTSGAGTAGKSPDLPSYAYGALVTLTATPGSGWAFTGWTGDTTAATNPLALAMLANRTLVAHFADVTAPAVSVLAPNGGEVWNGGETHSIQWSAADNAAVDSVDIHVSVNGGAGPWVELAHGLANSGSWSWLVQPPFSTGVVIRVTARDAAANVAADTSDAHFEVRDNTAGAEDGPPAFALSRPTPNPSGGAALLSFSLSRAGSARIEVLDPSGRRIARMQGEFAAGRHSWSWDGHLADGSRARAGLYFVRLLSAEGHRTQRMVRLD